MQCPSCKSELKPGWKVCPECGLSLLQELRCLQCGEPMQANWKRCPSCETPLAAATGRSVTLKDSVVKELHQASHHDVRQAGGAVVGGGINIHMSQTGADTAESEYEVFVFAVLEGGGRLGAVRVRLDELRNKLGLSRRMADKIENFCANRFGQALAPDKPGDVAQATPLSAPSTPSVALLPAGLTEITAENCELLHEQQQCAAELGLAVAVRDHLGLEFVLIPPGEFIYGTVPRDWGLRKQQITMEDAFYLGKYPITLAQWELFMQDADHDWEAFELPAKSNCPITEVNWDDAHAFCCWLGKATNLQYRLPSEVEWEKAARGSDGRQYPWGNTQPNSRYAHSDVRAGTPIPVGSRPDARSPYGCQDMVGNVGEWVRDRWDFQGNRCHIIRGGRVSEGASCFSDGDFAGHSHRSAGVGFRVGLYFA